MLAKYRLELFYQPIPISVKHGDRRRCIEKAVRIDNEGARCYAAWQLAAANSGCLLCLLVSKY